MTQALDAVRFPLWGSRLIEASAGTGKTWTIAALYVRLVLGHGGEDAGFGRPLLPGEILVMTYTRAATRELSDRIRRRLLEAARCFRGEAPPGADDALLHELLAAHPPGEVRAGAAWRLAMAAEGMDDAAVHTIDAWCQRMLREHAFDSGCLFDEELLANEDALIEQACRDYWRQHLYVLPDASLDAALDAWRTVEDLTQDVRALLEQPIPEGAGEASLADLIGRLSAERAATLGSLKAGWGERAQQMRAWIDEHLAGKNALLIKGKLTANRYPGWLDALRAWAEDPDLPEPALTAPARLRFTPAGMAEAVKPGATLEIPGHFAAFEQLLADLGQLPALKSALRLHAAACVVRRLDVLKRQAGTFGFADMLARLDAALAGPNASRLRASILAQYPVALVDEFQDTSPVQSRIFETLYRTEDNDRTTALLLIGDPKQSIYGFRGADIHSYLRARRATAGRHYVLATNHRSTAPLVNAVNRVFARAERLHGQGAFRFRAEQGGEDGTEADNPLPFVSVAARGRPERLVTSAGPHPALSVHHDTQLLDKKTSRQHFAARCAEQIAVLLGDARAGFEHPQAGFTPLAAADIAVLVRDRKEAAAVRRQLRERGVASVYLSEKESVFASGEARDLLPWLAAVAAPLDAGLVRIALATRTAGLSVAALSLLAADDEALDARSEDFRQLLRTWQSQGVLTMLRQTLHLLALPTRWLAEVGEAGSEPDGERRLTNFLHLAELLQAASARLDGEQALIRWLASQLDGIANQLDGSLPADDERIVRLESDAGLVKVVTIHKSKGLEYPVVFLPFACHFRGVDKGRVKAVVLADAEGARRLHLEISDDVHRAAEAERHREDLRLLYVALTRARHAVWVGFAALKDRSKKCTAHRSAIGFALVGIDPVHEDQLLDHLQDLAGSCPDIALAVAGDPATRTRLQAQGAAPELHERPPYDAAFERHWSIGSFSALVRSIAVPAAASALSARDDEALEGEEGSAGSGLPAARASTGAAPAAQPWHAFPRGAMPGNFLHGELEWLAGEDFALDTPEVARQLLRRCERQGWGHRGEEVLGWLQQVVRTVLPPVGTSLDALATRLPEMEFWFASQGLASRQVDALCRRYLLGGRVRPALPDRTLHGMLMGFADLVFEHGGRYWVLDYKSNYLGACDEDYGPEALEAAMAAHRYDVQAAVYLLALHRLLKARLGDAYAPETHLGGAVFFFLRGLQGPAGGCHLVEPHAALLDGLDALFQGREALAS